LLAVYVNWFNPLAWLMVAEISKACELSCDESVMRDFERSGREAYRERFNSQPADPATLKDSFVALCEEKRTLKEWLGEIIADKKNAFKVIFAATALVAAAVLPMLAISLLSARLQGL
jgi:beta-lactamase regulating signal transducer with metallopeptidase domain